MKLASICWRWSGKSSLSYHIDQGPTQLVIALPLRVAAKPLHVMMASNDTSPIRMGHAVAKRRTWRQQFPQRQTKAKDALSLQEHAEARPDTPPPSCLDPNRRALGARLCARSQGQHHPHPDYYWARAAQGRTAPSGHAIPLALGRPCIR